MGDNEKFILVYFVIQKTIFNKKNPPVLNIKQHQLYLPMISNVTSKEEYFK